MYNGIGLQTARGSGTNGYIQTNKFFVRPKSNKLSTEPKGFGDNQGTAGVSKKPNKDILEHDRKRQIQLKLVVLEEKLLDQGYTDDEIVSKLDEARRMLEAADKAEQAAGVSAIVVHDKRVSDTQTHQIAARKEKQMETLRAALKITSPSKNQNKSVNNLDDEESNDDEKLENVPKNGNNASVQFLARDTLDKKDDSDKGLKDEDLVPSERIRISKLQKKNSSSDTDDSNSSRENVKRSKKKYEKIRVRHHRGGSSSDSDSDSRSDGVLAKRNRKKHHSTRQKKHHNTRQASDSDDESDPGVQNISRKSSQKYKKSRRHDTEGSDYDDEIDDKSRWRGGLDNESSGRDETPERVHHKVKLDSRSRLSESSESDSREDIKKKQVESRNAGYKEYKGKEVESRHADYKQGERERDAISGGDRRKIKDDNDYKERKHNTVEVNERERKRKHNIDEDDEREKKHRRGEDDKVDRRQMKDEDDRQGKKHKRDEEEEEKYDNSKGHYRARHEREQEERHDTRSLREERPSHQSKRARHDDSRSIERSNDIKKRDDRREDRGHVGDRDDRRENRGRGGDRDDRREDRGPGSDRRSRR